MAPVEAGTSGDTSGGLEVHWLGRIAYERAWSLQKRLAAARADDRIGDQLLLLEHPAVLTLGRISIRPMSSPRPRHSQRAGSTSSASSAAAR